MRQKTEVFSDDETETEVLVMMRQKVFSDDETEDRSV